MPAGPSCVLRCLNAPTPGRQIKSELTGCVIGNNERQTGVNPSDADNCPRLRMSPLHHCSMFFTLHLYISQRKILVKLFMTLFLMKTESCDTESCDPSLSCPCPNSRVSRRCQDSDSATTITTTTTTTADHSPQLGALSHFSHHHKIYLLIIAGLDVLKSRKIQSRKK